MPFLMRARLSWAVICLGPKTEETNRNGKDGGATTLPIMLRFFVLSHKERAPVEMEGGTIFHFVTDGIESALRKAKEAARDRNVKIMGGADTVNQYLIAGLIDELWLHVVPVTIGAGARLFEGVPSLKLEAVQVTGTSVVTHIRYKVLK